MKQNVPDIEYFYGFPYKFFCGSCGRCIMIGRYTKEALEKSIKACKWCQKPVDWSEAFKVAPKCPDLPQDAPVQNKYN